MIEGQLTTVWLIGNTGLIGGQREGSGVQVVTLESQVDAETYGGAAQRPDLCIVAAMTPYSASDPLHQTVFTLAEHMVKRFPGVEVWLCTAQADSISAWQLDESAFSKVIPWPLDEELLGP